MGPLLQMFEISYPDGYLFLDRGGALCRRLRELIPGLDTKSVDRLQIEMETPDQALYLYFGVRRAAIQCRSHCKSDFSVLAAEFTSALTTGFDISSLESFRIKRVVGRPCASMPEATALLRPLISLEGQQKLESVSSESEWRAVQAEYVRNNLAFVDRIAVIEFSPSSADSVSANRPEPSGPHITVHIEVTGLVPVAVSVLDVAALLHNLGHEHLKTVIARIAPHLSPS